MIGRILKNLTINTLADVKLKFLINMLFMIVEEVSCGGSDMKNVSYIIQKFINFGLYMIL